MQWTWADVVTSKEFLASSAHVGWAVAVVLFAGYWLGPWPAFGAFVTFWALPKEFIVDVLPKPWGEGDSWTGSLIDFAGYVAGGLLGVGAGYLVQ